MTQSSKKPNVTKKPPVVPPDSQYPMIPSPHTFRSVLLACAAALPFGCAGAAEEPISLVFQNGRSINIAAVSLQNGTLVVTATVLGYTEGQIFPVESVDHVYGEKPAQLNPAIALLLSDKLGDALKLLEPILASQKITAKFPGNFWLEAARAALVAYAVDGNSAKCTEIGKEISDSTPASGLDPFVALGKALLMSATSKPQDREQALRDLVTSEQPADVSAYAAIYLGNMLKTYKHNPDAAEALKMDALNMEAYLMVPCLFPSGGMVLNGVAELKASEFLSALGRRDEALAIVKSAIQHSAGTMIAIEANKRLESLK